MLIRIDPGSDQPIYLQIAKSIETQIEGGALRAGERLPSARSLSASLGINMHTVLKAYAELQDRSLVEMRRGRGGVVVSETTGIDVMARELVGTAKRRGMTQDEVQRLIWDAWR